MVFFGVGGGVVVTPLLSPWNFVEGNNILLNQTGVESGLKVGFLEVSNPGLEGF